MSDKNAKALRKSLRNVVQDILPSILTEELTAAIYKKLSAEMGQRMDIIANNARETLSTIDERQKDIQSFVTRSLENSVPKPSDNPPPADSL